MITRIRPGLLIFSAILSITVFTIFVETPSALAQYGYSSFGYSPPLSPWLGLANRPTGALDPYNQYVRPQLEMQRALGSQQSQINQQAMQQQEMLRRSNLGAQPTKALGGAQTPGGVQMGTHTGVRTVGRAKPAASFRNYSHYYPNQR